MARAGRRTCFASEEFPAHKAEVASVVASTTRRLSTRRRSAARGRSYSAPRLVRTHPPPAETSRRLRIDFDSLLPVAGWEGLQHF